jgi:hypothetical protein
MPGKRLMTHPIVDKPSIPTTFIHDSQISPGIKVLKL